MKNAVDLLTGNLILNLSILAWALAQVMKFFIVLFTEGRLDWQKILASGGMPSSHSATVCACASSVGYLYGTTSPLFSIAAVLAVVVMYDAANVRRAVGEQGRILNRIIENWDKIDPNFVEQSLKEILGHTLLQVIIGALLGVAIGLGGAWAWG